MSADRTRKAYLKWEVYESNVQQYRALGATVQSFFLAVGSLIATSSRDGLSAALVMSLVAIVGIFHLYYIWYLSLRARHKIVDYYKFQIHKGLDDASIAALEAECSEHDDVNNAEKRKQANANFFGEPNLPVFRTTRMKFDIVVPLMYSAIWVVLWTWTVFR